MTRHIIVAAATLLFLLGVTGCGRKVASVAGNDTQVLTLNPSTLSIQTNQPAPLTAIVNADDGSVQDMTQQVTWRTSAPAITISKGTATCKQAGDYTVTASTATLSASASVTCIEVVLAKIVKELNFVSPPAAIVSNAPVALTVNATYSDGSVGDVTAKVTWTGDSVTHLSPQGVVSCNGAGTSNIAASMGAIAASIQLPCFMKHRRSRAGFVKTSAVFYGPFPSWLDLRDFHVVGDGVADDTVAFRAGLVAAAQQGKVLYVPNPAVVYNISDTLHLRDLDGVTVIGQDPKKTRILWTGVVNGTLLSYEGSSHFKLARLALDGGNYHGGVATFMDYKNGVPGQLYPTADLLQDVTITNFSVGIVNAWAGETSVSRVHFDNVKSGVALMNFNALNFNVTDCKFTNNNVGMSNDPGAGAFNVSHSVFEGSTYADMVIGNTGTFSLRDNISDSQQAFLVVKPSAAAAVVTAQRNVIRRSKSVPFQFSNPSVLLLVGNTFEAPADPQQALVVSQGSLPMQIFSYENQYTSGHPFQGNLSKVQIVDEQPQPDVPLSDIQIPDDVYVPPSSGKPVIEVPSQATAATIQQLVNEGAGMLGGAVVHFSGVSVTTATIDVPHAPELALVGDGFVTYICDGGIPQGGPVLRTHGAVQMQDFIVGASTMGGGIQVWLDDEPSSQFLCDDCTTLLNTNVSVSVVGLDNAKVNFRSSQINGVYGFDVSGGSNQAAGRTGFGSVNAFMTTSSTFKVGHNGRFLITDGFHDGGQPPLLGQISDGSVVTYDGGFINSGQGLSLKAFKGVMSFLGVQINGPVVGDAASAGNVGMVATLNQNTSINLGSGTQLNQASAYTYVPVKDGGLTPMSMAAAAVGDIEHLFAQAQNEDVLPQGTSDSQAHVVHLRHIAVASGAVAISIGPNPAKASTTTYVITDPSNTVKTSGNCVAGTLSIAGTWTLDPGNDGFYGLKSMMGYLGNVLPSGGGIGSLDLLPQMTDAGQRWLVEPTGDGTFTITSRSDGSVLTRTSSGCATMSTADGSSGQNWAVSGATL